MWYGKVLESGFSFWCLSLNSVKNAFLVTVLCANSFLFNEDILQKLMIRIVSCLHSFVSTEELSL